MSASTAPKSNALYEADRLSVAEVTECTRARAAQEFAISQSSGWRPPWQQISERVKDPPSPLDFGKARLTPKRQRLRSLVLASATVKRRWAQSGAKLRVQRTGHSRP